MSIESAPLGRSLSAPPLAERRQCSQLLAATGKAWSDRTHQPNPFDPSEYTRGLADGYLRHAERICTGNAWQAHPEVLARIVPQALAYCNAWKAFSREQSPSSHSPTMSTGLLTSPPHKMGRRRVSPIHSSPTSHRAADALIRAHQAFVRAFAAELIKTAPTTPAAMVLRHSHSFSAFRLSLCSNLQRGDRSALQLLEWLVMVDPALIIFLPTLVLLDILPRIKMGQPLPEAIPEIFRHLDLQGLAVAWRRLSKEEKALIRTQLFSPEARLPSHLQSVLSALTVAWDLNRADYTALISMLLSQWRASGGRESDEPSSL